MLTYEFEEPDEKDESFRFKINHVNPEAVTELLKVVRELEPKSSNTDT